MNKAEMMAPDASAPSAELVDGCAARMSELNAQLLEQGCLVRELEHRLSQSRFEEQNRRAECDHLSARMRRLQKSLIYRAIRRLGLWGWLDTTPRRRSHSQSRRGDARERIAVDLTPLRPGGENGGAKIIAIQLVREFARLVPECDFVLLTARATHEELASLDAANVRRVCAGAPPQFGRTITSRFVPDALAGGLAELRARLSRHAGRSTLLRDLRADLLFCPFTAPYFHDPAVPAVSLVHDLQYLDHPEFFSDAERRERNANFRWACDVCDRLISVSEFVRTGILQNACLDPARVITIHNTAYQRSEADSGPPAHQVLANLDLREGRFLLYPANFWPHKNHEMLLTAFGMYRARQPDSDLRIVCTGTPGNRMSFLQDAAQRMGLGDSVRFPGYLPDDYFEALIRSCRALVFPSLYEGFGMPVLEAMAHGRPVLCGRVAGLGEVAGDSALFFNPRKPDDIVEAIERIVSDPALAVELAAAGRRRAARFGDSSRAARQFLAVFADVLGHADDRGSLLQGVAPDGWTGPHVRVAFGAYPAERSLEMEVAAPEWLPSALVCVRVYEKGAGQSQSYRISRGSALTIRRQLPNYDGSVEVFVHPLSAVNGDPRELGCVCRSARILSCAAGQELFRWAPEMR